MTTRRGGVQPPFYPPDLLADLQRTLAALADIEVLYEIERDYLEGWSGPAEFRNHLLAELQQCHGANRDRLESCLDGLRRDAGDAAKPRRTDH